MALRKQNISIGQDLDLYLATRVPEGGNASGAINTLAQRYGEIVARTLPQLTSNEWLLLFDTILAESSPDYAGVFSIPGLVRFAINHQGAAEKWSVTGPDLLQRLEAMSLCELYAILDAAGRFWIKEGGSNAERVLRTVGPGRILQRRQIGDIHE